jgi:hypothetical protein
VTVGGFISTEVAAVLADHSARTIARWCAEAVEKGTGPFTAVRIRRTGKAWEVHARDFCEWLAAAVTPRPSAPTASPEGVQS